MERERAAKAQATAKAATVAARERPDPKLQRPLAERSNTSKRLRRQQQEASERASIKEHVSFRNAANNSGRQRRSRAVPQFVGTKSPPDWNKFTHFSGGHSVKDLERMQRTAGRDLLDGDKPDKTGLWPIHWAAINNRSDMIEFMLKSGVAADKRCQNRLFANGAALHLAAMNGSLEAAAVLLSGVSSDHNSASRKISGQQKSSGGDLLISQRDAEGQTPLMRAAATRSKRMDTVRDLLRKNFWSLSGRPAEMALYLICKGAKWRDTEPTSGMNLMHLAIVNDYEDIVALLLVLDKQLLDVSAASINPDRNEQTLPKEVGISVAVDGFDTIDLEEAAATGGLLLPPGSERSSSNNNSSGNSTPNPEERTLLDRRAQAEEIVASGLKPLQLAILYGRISIIGQLWHARHRERLAQLDNFSLKQDLRPTRKAQGVTTALGLQREAVGEHALTSKQLKAVLFRACWSNNDELAKFIKALLLKLLIAIDLGLLALLWAPLYAGAEGQHSALLGLRGGTFLVSFYLTMALAFRVMLKNPGHLRRNSLQYLNLMTKLIQDSKKTQYVSTSEKPLIKLDSTSPTNKTSADNEQNNAEQAVQTPDWLAQFDLKDTVRLLCHKCQCIRRPRSRHCNYCNHCIQDFDHHCIYLGCCIGRQNRLDFLLMLILMTITSSYGTFLISSSLGSTEWSGFWHILAFVWIFKYVCLGLLLSFTNLRRACLGVTLYEEIRSKRIRRLFGRAGPPAEVGKSHRAFSTLKGSHWRYDPDRFLTGDLATSELANNCIEFANHISPDEYLLAMACADTPLARAVTSNDSRINSHKLVV